MMIGTGATGPILAPIASDPPAELTPAIPPRQAERY